MAIDNPSPEHAGEIKWSPTQQTVRSFLGVHYAWSILEPLLHTSYTFHAVAVLSLTIFIFVPSAFVHLRVPASALLQTQAATAVEKGEKKPDKAKGEKGGQSDGVM